MCELLFKHVGEFREHTSSHFCKIVDKMHDPLNQDKTYMPLDPEKVNDEMMRVFMDEDENSLYFTSSGINDIIKQADKSQYGRQSSAANH